MRSYAPSLYIGHALVDRRGENQIISRACSTHFRGTGTLAYMGTMRVALCTQPLGHALPLPARLAPYVFKLRMPMPLAFYSSAPLLRTGTSWALGESMRLLKNSSIGFDSPPILSNPSPASPWSAVKLGAILRQGLRLPIRGLVGSLGVKFCC